MGELENEGTVKIAKAHERSYLFNRSRCYVLVERSARLELDGYDLVVWHVVLEAFASDTR